MSRIPDDVTAEELARWRKQAEKEGPPVPAALAKIFPNFRELSDYRERWCAAEWLARTLDELGCDPELNQRICFANGQIAFHHEDPWQVAQEAVANFRQGKWEIPGIELAQRLFLQHGPQMLERYGEPDLELLREMKISGEFEKLMKIEPPFPHDPV